jgi:hypothetical protein
MFDELSKKRSRWRVFWPEVDDVEGAEEAIRLCSWFAFANAAISAVMSAFLVISGSMGAAALAGPILMTAIGLGVRRRWRSAAITGAALMGVGIVVEVARSGLPSVVDAFTFVAFLSGVRGTFAFARLRGQAAGIEAGGTAVG